eukprot:9461144-Alexandrium_andersonii.AAC.1
MSAIPQTAISTFYEIAVLNIYQSDRKCCMQHSLLLCIQCHPILSPLAKAAHPGGRKAPRPLPALLVPMPGRHTPSVAERRHGEPRSQGHDPSAGDGYWTNALKPVPCAMQCSSILKTCSRHEEAWGHMGTN